MSTTKATLKTYWETGDLPQQSQYDEFIDAVVLADPTEVTFNQIASWLSGGGGPKGEFVRFTFETIYDQPITGTPRTGASEVMIGYMVTENELGPFIYSESYPQDIIHYDASYQSTPTTATAAKGKILRRIDPLINVDVDCDWRVMLFDVKKTFLKELGMKPDYCTMTDEVYAGTIPSSTGANNSTAVNPQFLSVRGDDVIDTADTQEMLMFGDAVATNFENIRVELFAGYDEFISDTGTIQAEMQTAEFPAFVFHAPDSSTYARKDIHIRGAYGVFGDTDGTTHVRNFNGTFYGGYYRSLDQSVNGLHKAYDKNLVTHPECKRFVGDGSEQKHCIYDGGTTLLYYDNISGSEANIQAGGLLYNVTQDEYAYIADNDTGANSITLRGDFSHWANNNELTYNSTSIYYDGDAGEGFLEAGDVISNDTQTEVANLITINTGTNLLVVDRDVTGTWVNNDALSTSYKAFTADIHNAPAGPTVNNFGGNIHNAPAGPVYTAGNEAEEKFCSGISANNNYFNGYNFIYDDIENTKSHFQYIQRVIFKGIIKQLTCDSDLIEVVFESKRLHNRAWIGALPEGVHVEFHDDNPSLLSSTKALGSRIIDSSPDIRDDIHRIDVYNRSIEYRGHSTKTPITTGGATISVLSPATNEGFYGETNWKGMNMTSGVIQGEYDEADAQDLAGTLTVLGTYNRVRTNNNVNATLAWQRTGNNVELALAHAGANNGTFQIPFYLRIDQIT